MLTNPPFMRQKGDPPMYLRPLTPEEMEQWHRMRDNAEKVLRQQPVGGKDDVRTESERHPGG